MTHAGETAVVPPRFVVNEGVKIAYRCYGHGQPVVLVHGWSNEGRYWNEFGYVETLARHYQVIVPDLRGHGDSEPSEDCDYGDEAFSADVLAVLDDCGIASAHIVGYSLGGWITFELLRSHSERLRSVVVIGAHPYAQDLSQLRVFDPLAIAENWLALDAPLSKHSLRRLIDMDHQRLIDMAEDRSDATSGLKSMSTPCLMLCGTDDWHFAGMQRFASTHSSVEFVSFDGVDHMQIWMRSRPVLDEVSRFLERFATL